MCDRYNNKNYVIDIEALKHDLMNGLKLKNTSNRVQSGSWSKPYIALDTELKTKCKIILRATSPS